MFGLPFDRSYALSRDIPLGVVGKENGFARVNLIAHARRASVTAGESCEKFGTPHRNDLIPHIAG
jgi:hypothetical protein